jgi:small subunit ribosomal protein S5
MRGRDEQPKEFAEAVIDIARVARVVKGGRRFRFRALVAIGNRNDRVGVGIAKGSDVQTAITKAVDIAKKQMIDIALINNGIPHEVLTRVAGSQVMLKPAPAGTGIIAGGTVRNIIELTGIHNVVSKTHGSTNKVNVAYATIDALRSLIAKEHWVTSRRPAPAKPSAKATAPKPGKAAVKKAPAKAAVKKAAKPKAGTKS